LSCVSNHICVAVLNSGGARKGVFQSPHKKKSILQRLINTFSKHGGRAGLAAVGVVFICAAAMWLYLATIVRRQAWVYGSQKKNDELVADVDLPWSEGEMAPLAVASAMAAGAAGIPKLGV
jgi:hypothetical protein